MSWLDKVGEFLGGSGGDQEAALYDRLRSEMGNSPSGAMLQSEVNRGVLPGRRSPWAEGMGPETLGRLDRYAWGKQAGLGGLPAAAGYEALKGISQSPLFRGVLPTVASALHLPDPGGYYQQDETSSPASLGNVRSYLRGALTR